MTKNKDMAARSLNKVLLIGNLTHDPELRYTPTGAAVCTFSLATSRAWTTDTGEKREETEFHRVVAWRKLAEICGQYLVKGKKIYIEGHLATRKWTTKEGQERTTTEIIMDDMIMLDSKRAGDDEGSSRPAAASRPVPKAKTNAEDEVQSHPSDETEDVSPEDIPF